MSSDILEKIYERTIFPRTRRLPYPDHRERYHAGHEIRDVQLEARLEARVHRYAWPHAKRTHCLRHLTPYIDRLL